MAANQNAGGIDTSLQATDFEAMRLKTGELLLMQLKDSLDTNQYKVTYIGSFRDKGFITSLPAQEHKGIWLKTGMSLNFKVLHGKYAYAFSCKTLRAHSRPYPYAHFSIPETIMFRQIRAACRLKTLLPVEIRRANGTHSLAILRDISSRGARLELVGFLDEIGTGIELTLPIILPESNHKIALGATIRNVSDIERSLAAGKFQYGVEFGELAAEEAKLLQFFVDHLAVEQYNMT